MQVDIPKCFLPSMCLHIFASDEESELCLRVWIRLVGPTKEKLWANFKQSKHG